MKDGIKDFLRKGEELLELRNNAKRVLFGIRFFDINHFAGNLSFLAWSIIRSFFIHKNMKMDFIEIFDKFSIN